MCPERESREPGGLWGNELELDWGGESREPASRQPRPRQPGCVWRAGRKPAAIASPWLLPAVLRHVSPLAADRQAAGLGGQMGSLSLSAWGPGRVRHQQAWCRANGLPGPGPGSSSSRPPSALCFPDSPAPRSFRAAPCTPGSP